MVPPSISLVTPVFDPRLSDFAECAASVRAQTFAEWEWIIVDDGSSDHHIIRLLAEYSKDPRITLTTLETNSGIVVATNAAVELAQGEFLAFLDHDDMLLPEALEVVARVVEAQPDVDFIYSDEAKIGPTGALYDWFAKPDWSPERLRGHNYCNHLSVIRTSVVRDIGALREGFDGAQDHDLVLRVSERAREIVHIPQVLYLWRAIPGSTAADETAKPQSTEAGCRAVSDHLARLDIEAEVVASRPGRYQTIRRLSEHPMVSILVPTRGDLKRVGGRPIDLVANAIESIVATSEYPNLEIVVAYDDATSANTLERLHAAAGKSLKLIRWSEPFNFARKVNLSAVRSSGEVVILLNDDTEIVTPDWIEIMIGLLQEPGVGMVGPMLLLADGRIQSAGHHYTPTPLHIGAGAPADDAGPHAMFAVAGERSGVTAACAALRRSTFFQVGGMSEQFPNCYNDVDLGFKLLEAGYRIVWTPHAKLHHFESLTRDPAESPEEARELERRWWHRLGHDAYAKQLDLWWAEVPFVPPDPGAPSRGPSDG